MSFYLFRALEKAGSYESAFDLWGPWKDMVDLRLTIWAESPEGNRSDCHAWGAVPLYEFPALLLGVQPAEPGFARIRVSPNPGPLKQVEGTVPTPFGPVEVKWRRDGGVFTLSVNGPEQTPIQVGLPDGTFRELESSANVLLICHMVER